MDLAKKLDGHQGQLLALQIGMIIGSILAVAATVITIVYTL